MIIKRKVLVHNWLGDIKYINLDNILYLFDNFNFQEIPTKSFDINCELDDVIAELKEQYIKDFLPKNNKIWDGIKQTLWKCELKIIEYKIQKDIESIQIYKIIDNINLIDNNEFCFIGNTIIIKDDEVWIKEIKNIYHRYPNITKEFIKVNNKFFEEQ